MLLLLEEIFTEGKGLTFTNISAIEIHPPEFVATTL